MVRQRQAEGELSGLRAAAEERRRQGERLRRWLSELALEQERAERRQRELAGEHAAAQQGLADTAQALANLHTSGSEAAGEQDALETELRRLVEEAGQHERAASEEGRRLAGLEERLRGERRREAGLRAQQRALGDELDLRGERLGQVDRERIALQDQLDTLVTEVAVTESALAAEDAARGPLREEVARAEGEATRLGHALQAARAASVERDRERDHAGFAWERAEQEWEALGVRIREDLDLIDADDVLKLEIVASDQPEAEREREITRLRERLRRVGYVGDDAVADYEREMAQQTHLREQMDDVQGAAAALRKLLAELRLTMRSRFEETFAQVAVEFAAAFSTLFGGGTARLELTGSDIAEPGIDIIAQPPGKRLQNLSLLSGGERALTAAALLIAILKVNPAPFCLLDEVDAALDEANVVRFRERLQDLAQQTQIIVVTHNRGTIEIADTLYGVTMGADGVSQVLSMRMTDVPEETMS